MNIYENHGNNTKFLEAVEDAFLIQHVKIPTRSRLGNIPSTLDLILTNGDYIENITVESPLGKSDHGCVKYSILCCNTKEVKARKVYLYARGDYANISAYLSSQDWESLPAEHTSPDENYQTLVNKIYEAQDVHIPSKMLNEGKRRRFFTLRPEELTIIKKKHRAWTRYIETREERKYIIYTKLRNKVKKIIKLARNRLEEDICNQVKTNPKVFWSYVNSCSRTRSTIPDLHSPKGMATTDTQKANVLADFFSEVFTREPSDEEIPRLPDIHLPITLNNITIEQTMVHKRLQQLKPNKAAGPDKMHPRVLRECAIALAKPVSIIFNQTINSGVLPSTWKKATVSPIYKKGRKQSPENYRPISLTSIPCKILESIIRDHILEHMINNNLLSDRQYGFVSKRSTTLQLLQVMEVWTQALDDRNEIEVAYMDFQKAFDKVPHHRLLHKLEHYGIRNPLLIWIERYLSGRHQSVVINGSMSSWYEVHSGIPQGSVLGPILFIIFINDLPQEITSHIYLFADDTKLFKAIATPIDQEEFQKDISQVATWTERWLLPLNGDKCSVMHLGNTIPVQDVHLPGNPNPMKRTKLEKDLGIFFRKYRNL
jgi:hypothetical protein